MEVHFVDPSDEKIKKAISKMMECLEICCDDFIDKNLRDPLSLSNQIASISLINLLLIDFMYSKTFSHPKILDFDIKCHNMQSLAFNFCCETMNRVRDIFINESEKEKDENEKTKH